MSRPSVPRVWSGDAVCIASGPSLTAEDVAFVRGKAKAIAINASYAIAPWADVLYCADVNPFKWYWNSGPRGYESVAMRDFQGKKYSLTSNAAKYAGVVVLKQWREEGLSLDPTKLCLGKNSGYQAINLAVLLGAKRIVLLGYDMQPGPGGEYYFGASHPDRKRSPYKSFREKFPTIVKPLKDAGVEIVNCSRQTALTCFPRKALTDVFAAVECAA
jgi:hypothetical protein